MLTDLLYYNCYIAMIKSDKKTCIAPWLSVLMFVVCHAL